MHDFSGISSDALNAGDMVLVGARSGQGKTLQVLELAALAGQTQRQGYFFTLEYTELDVWQQVEHLGYDLKQTYPPIVLETSDDICADHIIKRLEHAGDDALIVVDYMQVLDQRRSNPPLHRQMCALKAFAADTGAVVVLHSQVDRAFDASSDAVPDLDALRLPNPVDLSLFDMRCFLHDGTVRLEPAA